MVGVTEYWSLTVTITIKQSTRWTTRPGTTPQRLFGSENTSTGNVKLRQGVIEYWFFGVTNVMEKSTHGASNQTTGINYALSSHVSREMRSVNYEIQLQTTTYLICTHIKFFLIYLTLSIFWYVFFSAEQISLKSIEIGAHVWCNILTVDAAEHTLVTPQTAKGRQK